MQAVVGLRHIRDFHVLRVPEQLLVRESQGNISQKRDLRQQAGRQTLRLHQLHVSRHLFGLALQCGVHTFGRFFNG
jgi:hypothetical protein